MGRKSIVLDKTDCDFLREKYHYDPETGLITFRTTKGCKAGRVTGLNTEQSGYKSMFVTLPSGRRLLKVHLIGWSNTYGVWPDHEVDHEDGDKSNNRLDNLRRATGSQNRANIKKYKTWGGKPTSSQYKGVSWIKDKSQWMAYIRVDKKLIKLGYFDDEVLAAKTYDTAARAYHSAFAVLNFP